MTENEKKFNEIAEIKQKAAADAVNYDIDKVLDYLESMAENGEEITDTDAFLALFAMPDDQFNMVSEFILESIQQILNSGDTPLTLVQAMNLSGINIEQLRQGFKAFEVEIEKNATQLQEEYGIELTDSKKTFLKKFGALFVNKAAEAESIAKKIIEIPVTLEPNGKVPSYAHFGDAGADLYANIKEDISIKPGETVMIPTGVSVAIPKGYELQIRPRSGMSAKTKLRVANAPGTIDSGYRGQICVIMENIAAPIKDITYDFDDNGKPIITSILHGEEYTIHNGDRIAQAILSEVPQASYMVVEKLPDLEDDNRGEGGFGSTGE